MRMYDIIKKKRDGYVLSNKEIEFFIENYTNDNIPDYQVSALLMAIYFQGMTYEESASLTMAMVHSGKTIDLSTIDGIKVDKHSTGGVGDSVSLILSPLVASLGIPVPKMSGRGLGHTGGTIDKLESIAGFNVELDKDTFIEHVNQYKLAIIGQSKELAPADKLLYSLRDVTATVDSIPLIASSIMSKKIASGADKIVLDVKTGSGAFMAQHEDAKQLAETMVKIGDYVGKQTVAVISNMNQPLGKAVGNAIEIKEAIETLQGNGPEDLTDLCLTLGSEMVVLAEKAPSPWEARRRLEKQIKNGQALHTFKSFIKHQNGDEQVVDNLDRLPSADYKIDIYAKESGIISQIDAHIIGKASLLLGAGRETKDSMIDLAVGIMIDKKINDKVSKGDRLFTVHSNKSSINDIKQLLYSSIQITENEVENKLIFDIIK